MQGFFSLLGICALILDGKTAAAGAVQGLELCLRTVIPALFPFFFLGALITGTNPVFSGVFRPVARAFGLPKGSEGILLCAVLGGYPSGAQGVSASAEAGTISRDTARRMLAFCNNAGPSFLFGISASLFTDASAPWVLWGIHLLSAWCVSVLFPCPNAGGGASEGKEVSIQEAFRKALIGMASVCGWVVLFRVLIGFLDRWVLWLLPTSLRVCVIGLLELTNGCCELSSVGNEGLRFCLCSAFLALGGLCVSMQTASVAKNISLKDYYPGKLLQCGFSLIFSAAWVNRWWGLFFLPAAMCAVKIKKTVAFPGRILYNGINKDSGRTPHAVP